MGQEAAGLRTRRLRLDSTLSSARSLFAEIETRLSEPGLEAQLERWRAARRRIEARAGELASWAGQLESALLSGNLRAADAYLELARGSLALTEESAAESTSAIRSRPEDERPNPRLMVSKGRGAASRAADSDEPTPAHLAETKLVQIPQAIRAKANELKSPAAISTYVRDNFECEFYYGFMQGSAGVYWSGRGNAWDLSAFLIAHLRAAGIPARFVAGFVTASYPTAMAWLGTTNKAATDRLLRAATYVEPGEKTVSFDHVWVEAYLDTASGKKWLWADPGFKVRQWMPRTTLPRVSFDRMKYLATKTNALATDLYIDQVRDLLRLRQPGVSLLDGAANGRLLDYSPAADWDIEEVYFRLAEPDSSNQHRASIKLQDVAGATLATADARLAENVLGQWSITFGPASPADARAMSLFGGLDATPAAAVALVPQVRLDGKVVAAGTREFAAGDPVTVSVDYIRGGQKQPSYTGTHTVRAGETAVINFHGFQATDRFIGKLVDDVTARVSANPGTDPEATVRDMLHIAGLRYFRRYWGEKQRLGAPLGLRPAIPSGEEASTQSTLELQQVFETPFVVTPGRMLIDADGMTAALYDLDSDVVSSPELTGIRQTLGLASSSLEHELWEEVAFTPAISTTRALQVAAQGGIAIRTITKDNALTEIPKLQLAAANKTSIQAEAARGQTVIVPESQVTLGQWRGAAWISEDSNGYGAFIISRYSGGDTGTNKPQAQPGSGTTGDNGTSCGSPVSVSSGNMYHQFIDFDTRGRGLPLRLVRTYNSQSALAGPFGYGWTHNLARKLITGTTNITYVDDSGGRFAFMAQSTTPVTYTSPGTLGLTLSRDQQGFLLRAGDGTEIRFNTGGRMEKLTDWRGNAQTFTYDGRGNLTEAIDASGNRVSLRYDGQDRVTEATDQTGGRVQYGYSSAGDLTSSVDPAGNRTAYTYYSSRGWEHNLRQIVYPEGGAITFEYYGNDRVSRVVNPAGGDMRFFYMPVRSETLMVDERGLATSFTYDAAGNVVRIVRPDGGVLTNTYDASGRLTARTDEGGYTTTYEYDSRGRMTRMTDAAKASVQYTYEADFNQLTSFRDRKGNTTRFEYEAKGFLTAIVDPAGGERKYAYSGDGLLTSITDAEGRVTSFTYDGQGRRTEIRDNAGNVNRVRYDSLGRTVAMVDAAGEESRMEYDANGNLTRIVNRSGDAVTYEYDRNGNRTRRTDARGKTRRYGFDKLDALAEVTDAIGNTTRYGNAPADCPCSSNGALSSIRTAAGRTTKIVYDDVGRVAAFSDPQGHTGRLWYDARGNALQTVDRDGNTVKYEYDAVGRLMRRSFATGGEDVFTRDANGNVLTSTSNGVTFRYEYDALDRVTSVTDSRNGKSVRYTYDKTGRRLTMTDHDGGVTAYKYDKAGTLASVANPRGEVFEFRNDAVGRRTGITLANGVKGTYEYDKIGRLTSLVYKDPGGATLAQWAYKYDANGNRIAAVTAAGEHTWQYDDLDRVTGATHPDAPAESYSYDAEGNLISTAAAKMTCNAEGEMTVAGDAVYTYDKRGNPVKRTAGSAVTRFGYDGRSRLTRVELPDGKAIEYLYDVGGSRIGKSVDGVATRYVYDGLDLIAEVDASGRTVANYTYGPDVDEPLAMRRDGRTHYYLADGAKNVAHLTDQAGAIVQSYAYEAYGRIVAAADAGSAVVNPFTFAGRELDGETGLMYFRARYYDPATGRFLQQDPLNPATLLRGAGTGASSLARSMLASNLRNPQTGHSYGYAGNNPPSGADPLGMLKFVPHPYTAEECGVKVIPCKAGQTPGIIPGLTHMIQSVFTEGESGTGISVEEQRRDMLARGWRELTNQIEPADYLDVCDRKNPFCVAANEYRDYASELSIRNRLAASTVGVSDIPPICGEPGVKCDLELMRETGMGWDKQM